MIRLLEFLAFVGVALGLHLAAGMLSPPAGGDAGGDAGAAFVTLRGAPAEIDDIVAAWTKPPEHSEPRQSLHQPIIVPDTPRPRAQIAPQPRLRDRAAPAFRAPDDSAPQMDTRPAPPRPAAPTPKAIAPKTKQNTQKTAVSGQRAAGTGASGQSGTGGPSKSLGKGQESKLIAQWGGKIRARIERKKRAPRTAAGGGRVHLRIKLAPSGQLQSVRITKSSGVAAYDQAALNAVQRSGRFAKAPQGLTKPSYSFRFSITFQR